MLKSKQKNKRKFFLSFLNFSFFSSFFSPFLFFLFFMNCSVLTEAQVLSIAENTMTQVNISDTDPTRIVVENDRIAVLRGMDGAYTYSNDNNSGAVFLKPSNAYKNKFFYIFISTEQNHNYVLQLKPTPKLSAGVLILKSHSQALSVAQHWETDSPYVDTLTKLITGMVNADVPEGYEVITVNAKKTTSTMTSKTTSLNTKNTKGTKVQMRLKTVYSGAYLQGEVYEVINKSLFPVTLLEPMFYQSGDRAIALRDSIVPIGGKTRLYKVNSHG